MNGSPEPTNRMGRPNQPPKPECCRQPGQATSPTVGNEAQRTAGSVHREKCRPQAGVAPGLSNSASKQPDADGDAVIPAEPNTGAPALGEARPVCRGRRAWHVLKVFHETWEARPIPAAPTTGAKRVGARNDKERAPRRSRDSDRLIVVRSKARAAPIRVKEPTRQRSLQRKPAP